MILNFNVGAKFSSGSGKDNVFTLDQIVTKLKNIEVFGNNNFTSKSGKKWRWQADILGLYQEQVQKAMATVDAVGGYATFDFSRLGLGSHAGAKWDNLSPYTLERKAAAAGMGNPHADKYGTSNFDYYKWNFKIWQGSGTTLKGVVVSGSFAGINGSTPVALSRAAKVEGGGFGTDLGTPVPARPLFAAANSLMVAAIMKNINETGNPLRISAEQEFVNALVEEGLWGSGTTGTSPDSKDNSDGAAIAKMFTNYQVRDITGADLAGMSTFTRSIKSKSQPDTPSETRISSNSGGTHIRRKKQ